MSTQFEHCKHGAPFDGKDCARCERDEYRRLLERFFRTRTRVGMRFDRMLLGCDASLYKQVTAAIETKRAAS